MSRASPRGAPGPPHGMATLRTKLEAAIRHHRAGRVDRAEPLTPSGASPSTGARKGPMAGGRKVQTGAVPDFKYPGPGVRLGSVLEGSALAEAGLKPGDVLTTLDGRPIRDLRSYSLMLRRYQPGQRVQVQAQRGDQVINVTVTLKAR